MTRALRTGPLATMERYGRGTINGALPVVRFSGPRLEGSVYVDERLLDSLVWLVDGEPELWKGSGPTKPLCAFTDRGHLLGAVMPVRVPDDSMFRCFDDEGHRP